MTSETTTAQHAGADAGHRVSTRALVIAGIIVSLVLAGFVSYYASSSPDGLEHVAATTGFENAAAAHASSGSPLADYATKGVDNPRLSGGLAGVIGCVLVLALAGGLFAVIRRGRPPTEEPR